MNEEAQHCPDTQPAVTEITLEITEVAAAPAPLPTLGEIMIAARERWNLSAADVARQLRLGLRQVEALEANRFDTLPGNTFVRGFIRNYAKVVQIDPSTFLEAYARSRPQIQAPRMVARTEQIEFTAKPIPKWVWYISGLVAAVILLPVLTYLALHDDEPPAKSTSQAAAPKAALVLPQAQETPLTLPPPQVVSLGESALPAVLGSMPQDVPIPPAVLPVAATAPVLRLKFEGDAWVEVRDKSGKKIYSQLSRSGTEQSVQGEPPLSLVVGDAARVKITYNGKPVDLTPHVKKTVARLTLE